MADQASMGVDPSLLSLNPARTDEGAPAADVDADADEQPQDDTYTVGECSSLCSRACPRGARSTS